MLVSEYMVEETFADSTAKSNINFTLMHLNAQSLLGNFDNFKHLLINLRRSVSVIGVSETWLNELTCDQVNIPEYNFPSNHRSSKIGGGVGLYLHNNLKYKMLPECNFSNPDVIESLFIEIEVPNKRNIVGNIYQPPNQNTASFVDKLNGILGLISKQNKKLHLMGDFNLDLLHYSTHSPTQEFIDSLFSYGFYPLISKPTRITSHSATFDRQHFH